MNALSRHTLSFHRPWFSIGRTGQSQLRAMSDRHKRNWPGNVNRIPKDLTVTFSVDKLFKEKKLDQDYIAEKIAEGLEPHLPAMINGIHRPSTSSKDDCDDFFLYYFLWNNIINDSHSTHSSYRSLDEGYHSPSHSSASYSSHNDSSHSSYSSCDATSSAVSWGGGFDGGGGDGGGGGGGD